MDADPHVSKVLIIGGKMRRRNERTVENFIEFALEFFSIDFTEYMYLYELTAYNDLKTLCIMS